MCYYFVHCVVVYFPSGYFPAGRVVRSAGGLPFTRYVIHELVLVGRSVIQALL